MQLTAFFIIFVLVMTSGGQMRKLKFSKNSFNSIQLSCSKEVDVPAAIVYRKRLSCLLFQFSSFHPPPAGPVTMSGSDMIRFSAFCNWRPVCFSPAKLTAQADAEQWPAHFSHILDASTPLFNHFPSIYSV